MDKASVAETYQFGDRTTSDITIHLRSGDGKPEVYCCHRSILVESSKFFADRLSVNQSQNYIEVSCPVSSDYENYGKLLKLLYFPQDSVLELLDSVESAVGVIRASIALRCEAITETCIRYLEAMPWEEKEEEEIHEILPTLGSSAAPLLMRFQQPDFTATKNVFISAIRFATTIDRSFPPFTDELRMSAQEQVDYMLADDEETPLVAVDEDVKSTARSGLAKMFSTLEMELRALPLNFSRTPEAAEQQILECLSDLDWMCNILPKMELMKEFVTGLAHISDNVLAVVQDEKYDFCLWGVKFRLVELVGKALEAVGFGSVVLPSASRVQFLKIWLPYLRKMKPILDSKSAKNEAFPYRMDVDLCQNIEGAIVSLVLALPSCDQADILSDWMKRTEQLKFPDLTEAFEVWCYRTKAAKRRLAVGFNGTSPRYPPPSPPPASPADDVRKQLATLTSTVLDLQAIVLGRYPHPSSVPGPFAPGPSAPGPSTAAAGASDIAGPSSTGRLSFDRSAEARMVPDSTILSLLDMMSPQQLRSLSDHVLSQVPAYMVEEYIHRADAAQGAPPADDPPPSSH